MMKTWTQRDLRFLKNKGPKRSKNLKKRGSTRLKITENIGTKSLKMR